MFRSRRVGILKLSSKTIRTAGMLWNMLMQTAVTRWTGRNSGPWSWWVSVMSRFIVKTTGLVTKKTCMPS